MLLSFQRLMIKFIFISIIVIVVMVGVMTPNAFAENKIVIILPFAGDPECANNDTCISPSTIYLEIGDTFSFEKQNNVNMSFASGRPDWTPEQHPDNPINFRYGDGWCPRGQLCSGQFNEPGIFYYFDMVHPWIVGKVVVGITNTPEQTYEDSKAIADKIKQELEQKQKIRELEGARNRIDVLENNLNDLFKNISNLEFQIEKLTIQNNNLKKQLEQQLELSVNIAEDKSIPSWTKDNAKWWSQGLITENEFIKGIEYLVQNNIIRIN
jgi:hypothetical protein